MGNLAPRSFETRSGRHVTVRSAIEADAAAVLEFMQAILSDGTGVISLPEEFCVSHEQERQWIRDHADGDGWIALLALAGDEVCGLAHLEGRKRWRRAHTVALGLALDPAWRGDGLGRMLLETLIAWASEHPELERIELGVIADNEPAIQLYERLGFVHEGRRPRAVRREDGSFVDDLQMALFV